MARLGVRRFNELLDRYGMDTVLTATHQLMDYTERVLRQRIDEIPDGEYRAEGFLDDDSRNRDVRLPIDEAHPPPDIILLHCPRMAESRDRTVRHGLRHAVRGGVETQSPQNQTGGLHTRLRRKGSAGCTRIPSGVR